METLVNITGTSWEINSLDTDTYNYSSYFDEYFDDLGHAPCAYESHENHPLRAFYSLFFMIGFVGNVFVVGVIMLGAQLRSVMKVCLLNLALADLITHSWIFGKTVCILVLGSYYVTFYCSAFFVVWISIDRYLVVTCGIVVCLVIWIVAVASSFPELLCIEVLQSQNEAICTAYMDNSENYDFSSVGIFKMNILGLVIPLSIVGFCFLMVMRKRVQSTRKPNTRLVALVAVVFFCCWTPYNIVAFLIGLQLKGFVSSNCDTNKWTQLALQISKAVAYSHCCLNPIIYVLVREKFKWYLVKLLRWTPCFKLPFVGRCLPQLPVLSSETSMGVNR
uniref:C-C motif chemokine receptor 8 n=1 Tax=Astyanax mexicanus TaxID=7994 RepID=A0A3B1J6K4_ASTMX